MCHLHHCTCNALPTDGTPLDSTTGTYEYLHVICSLTSLRIPCCQHRLTIDSATAVEGSCRTDDSNHIAYTEQIAMRNSVMLGPSTQEPVTAPKAGRWIS